MIILRVVTWARAQPSFLLIYRSELLLCTRIDLTVDNPLMPGPDPAGQRAERLDARVDRVEDAINHFYNVINELRERVSTLEKGLNPLPKDEWIN